jgi:hypothetical protein
MNRKRNVTISIISAALACLLVYGVHLLQKKQLELQQMVHVVVPKDFIKAGTLITADLIELKPIFAAAFDERMYTNLRQVVNQETLIPIGKGEPIVNWKIDKFNLLPNQAQATFQIPKKYILSISNGIRAGDKVRIYVSSEEDKSRRLFPGEITVASVRSSANIEVDDPKNSNLLSKANGDLEKMYVSRREANGVIDQINLNLSEEEWLMIDRICSADKAKLVIAFSSTSIIAAGEVNY